VPEGGASILRASVWNDVDWRRRGARKREGWSAVWEWAGPLGRCSLDEDELGLVPATMFVKDVPMSSSREGRAFEAADGAGA
jgi:hypothetical protein